MLRLQAKKAAQLRPQDYGLSDDEDEQQVDDDDEDDDDDENTLERVAARAGMGPSSERQQKGGEEGAHGVQVEEVAKDLSGLTSGK